MAWIGAVVGAGASLLGNYMSQSGQQQTNAQMLAQNKQIMDWETMMSDTAMSRRVSDLKSAGLNPMLAVQEGGASTPGAGPAALSNPMASWANLGNQASSAIGDAVQVAQAKNIEADTQSKVLDNVKKDPSKVITKDGRIVTVGDPGSVGPGVSAPGAVAYQTQVTGAQMADRQLSGQELMNKTMAYQLDNILPSQAAIASVDADKAKQILPYAIDLAKQQAKIMDLGVPEAQAKANYYSGPIGRYDPAIGRALEAVGVAGGLFGLAKIFRSSGASGAQRISEAPPQGLNPSGSDRMGNIDQYLQGK